MKKILEYFDTEQKFQSINLFLIIFVFIVLALSVLIQSYYYDHGFVSPDGTYYLSVAQNLLDNRSLMVNTIAGENERVFYSMWPSGYPIMIYLVAKVTGVSVFLASKLLNILFIGGIMLVFYKLFKDDAYIYSFILLLAPIAYMASGTLSEIQFIFGLLWFCVALTALLDSRNNTTMHFISITSACIFLFLSRYIGYFCVGVLSVACLNFLYIKDYRKFFVSSASIITTSLFISGYLLHNYVQSGYITGMPRFPPIESSFELVSMLVRSILAEINLLTLGLGTTLKSIVLFIFTFAIQIFLMYYFLKELKLHDFKNHNHKDNVCIVFIVVAAMYYMAIVYTRFTTYFTELNYRFMFPGTFLMLIGLTCFIMQSNIEKLRLNFVKFFIVVSILSFLVGTGLPFGKHITSNSEKMTYKERINHILEVTQDIPENSVVIFGDRNLLYLRNDLSIASPIFIPNFPEAETWDDFLERLKVKHPLRKYYVMIKGTNFFESIQKASLLNNYHESVVDFILQNKDQVLFEIQL
jgi:hypothetical protein